MAIMFNGTRFQSFKSDGTINAAGWVYFYEIGTSTQKTTYSNSSLTTANASPVVLNSAGAADIWYSGDADVSVYDSTGTLVDSFSNINPAVASTSNEANLIPNGSFESGSSITSPDGWVRATPYTGGTSEQDTDSSHGTYSWKFVSAGSGGGILTSESFFNVTVGRTLLLTWMMKSSVADVRNTVEVLWYDSADAYISASTAYDDSTTNPTSWTLKTYTATPVATAVKAKIRITGCHSSDATSGTTRFDGLVVTENSHLYSDNAFSGSNTHTGLESFATTKFSTPLGAAYQNNIAYSATAASNALTITVIGNNDSALSSTNPAQIAFRSTTLTTGTATVRTMTAPVSVVIPDGATLGFIASEACYINLYLIDNAGTVELAVTKSALNTNSLTTTTAISASSDSATGIYSTSARTSVACRYIGRILLTTGATPGQWSTPTSLSNITETIPMWCLGWGQTWQAPSRALNTTYTNSTGRPIYISLASSATLGSSIDGYVQLTIGGVTVDYDRKILNPSLYSVVRASGVVPPGDTYSATMSNCSLGTWAELR
jgi:hypothetical protein